MPLNVTIQIENPTALESRAFGAMISMLCGEPATDRIEISSAQIKIPEAMSQAEVAERIREDCERAVAGAGTPGPEPQAEEEKKPRRGRKPKEEAPVEAPAEPATPATPAASAPEQTELSALLEKFNAQMVEGELAEDKRTTALEKWRARGEEGIPELKKAIEANEEFLAKKRAAKAVAAKINAGAAAPSAALADSAVVKVDKPTLDMLRADLKYYTEKHGLDAGQELMKKYGASRISEMESKPVDKQIEFMKLCREQIHG